MIDDQPKKSLGQHWLNDQASLSYICELAKLGPDDVVLEIGSGQGALTSYLVKRARQVIALEIDDKLVDLVRRTITAPNLRVLNQNILKFNLTELPIGYKVVANIPYYLTSKLIRTLSESSNRASLVVILVQKEVAERVAAQAGQMSLLSVTTQFYWQTTLCKIIPAELFTPSPKVDSRVLVLEPKSKLPLEGNDLASFFQLVKAGFAARRKTLLNSLSAGLRVGKEEVEAALKKTNINPNIRPQELSLDDWLVLYGTIKTN